MKCNSVDREVSYNTFGHGSLQRRGDTPVENLDALDECKIEMPYPELVLNRVAEEQAQYVATGEWERDCDELKRLMGIPGY